MNYTPTLETIRAKMRRTNAALVERAQTAQALFAADEMAVALVALTAAEGHIAHLEREQAEMRTALEESVKLQSHYAGLLNTYDGGQRIQFASADDWCKRLAMTPEERKRDAIARAQEGKG